MAYSEHQVSWIRQCPNLTNLGLFSMEAIYRTHLDAFVARFTSGVWPEFRVLKIKGLGTTDEQLAKVIGSMSHAAIIETFKCTFGELSFKELRRCFASLKNVNISESGRMTSAMALEILVSCPHLEVLSVGPIMSRDVIDSPPWVCASSLKVLRASIQITPSQNSDVHQRHVLRRLSELVNLEILDLIGGGSPNIRTLEPAS
jgi:hypothetical protein